MAEEVPGTVPGEMPWNVRQYLIFAMSINSYPILIISKIKSYSDQL